MRLLGNTYSSVFLRTATLVRASDASNFTRRVDSRPCLQLSIPVTIAADNYIFDGPVIANNSDVVEFSLALDASDNTGNPVVGTAVVSGSFEISAQLCIPDAGAKASVLQIASHGITFEKRYWDSEYRPERYSYVDAALSQGYSILIYDRLGDGQSSRPNGIAIVQAPLHVEILKFITDLARSGQLLERSTVVAGVSPPSGQYQPTKIVHLLTGCLTAPTPSFPKLGAFGLQHTPSADPALFGSPENNYIVIGNKTNYHYAFISARTFDSGALDYYWSILQTVTVGEWLSAFPILGNVNATAPEFSGPVLAREIDASVPAALAMHGSTRPTYERYDRVPAPSPHIFSRTRVMR
ncbi:putative AB hydrolase-1 domain-containing protein [Seiridium unicorne]|uniref:AB hydrolase-1 domain-containing protein n=1 Tax=Seiridium unicorne TaxID=138068 RepID=A0ABR2VE44_9PEZI